MDCEKKAKKRAKTRKMLVGNKIDKGVESVTRKDIDDFCEKYKMSYIDCSALENYNVDKVTNTFLKRNITKNKFVIGF